jgi:hypothetical protein
MKRVILGIDFRHFRSLNGSTVMTVLRIDLARRDLDFLRSVCIEVDGHS